MSARLSIYTGYLVSEQQCHVNSGTGLVCMAPAITVSPAPLCKAHAQLIVQDLTKALEEAQ